MRLAESIHNLLFLISLIGLSYNIVNVYFHIYITGFVRRKKMWQLAQTWVTFHRNKDFLTSSKERERVTRSFVPFVLELKSFGMRFLPSPKMCTNPNLPSHHNMHMNTPRSKNKTLQNIPATLTFSELVALGVAVLVPFVRLPPVPL